MEMTIQNLPQRRRSTDGPVHRDALPRGCATLCERHVPSTFRPWSSSSSSLTPSSHRQPSPSAETVLSTRLPRAAAAATTTPTPHPTRRNHSRCNPSPVAAAAAERRWTTSRTTTS
uniref:(northern house mosquito) hypothetical protein n=1 Tax=Culex pipiens TaxID=7175 RepID=A0A8D8BWR1_CULPI